MGRVGCEKGGKYKFLLKAVEIYQYTYTESVFAFGKISDAGFIHKSYEIKMMESTPKCFRKDWCDACK